MFTKLNFAVGYKFKLKYFKNDLLKHLIQNDFFDKYNKTKTTCRIRNRFHT